jgi:hypothetical protein
MKATSASFPDFGSLKKIFLSEISETLIFNDSPILKHSVPGAQALACLLGFGYCKSSRLPLLYQESFFRFKRKYSCLIFKS